MQTPISTVLWRGMTKRCPHCGNGALFGRWHEVVERCPRCGCEFQKREGDCWAFMYITTAFLTGLFILGMLFIVPANLLLGRIAVGLCGLLVLALSLPYRKGIALALDYLIEVRFLSKARPDPPP